MVHVLAWLGLGLLAVAALIAVGWGMHRFCIRLEERGLMYYRTRPQGGGGLSGAMFELDAITRPSVVHVMEVKDAAVRKQQDEHDGE